jgi:hypothetical protein
MSPPTVAALLGDFLAHFGEVFGRFPTGFHAVSKAAQSLASTRLIH